MKFQLEDEKLKHELAILRQRCEIDLQIQKDHDVANQKLEALKDEIEWHKKMKRRKLLSWRIVILTKTDSYNWIS